MKRLFKAVLVGVLSLSVGCATILASKTQSLPITSNVDATEVYIDGVKRGTTPLTLELDPRRSYTIVFKKEGLEDKVFEVRNQVGAGWVILDILLGLIPVIVDASTGAWSSLEPESVAVAMIPPEPAKEQGAINCNLSGTPEWQSASAVQKKRMLDECKRPQGAP